VRRSMPTRLIPGSQGIFLLMSLPSRKMLGLYHQCQPASRSRYERREAVLGISGSMMIMSPFPAIGTLDRIVQAAFIRRQSGRHVPLLRFRRSRQIARNPVLIVALDQEWALDLVRL